MAINKLALIRYKTIDTCLQNKYRRWTLMDLIEKVSAALYEYEGIDSGVSKRTIQADIQLMRSDKLGYNAPIVVKEKKYYVYDESGYSINNSKLSDSDIEKMSEMVGVLREMSGFTYFDEMNDIAARLESSLLKSTGGKESYIQLEGNSLLKGLQYITPLYQAIRNKVPLLITYRSFKAKDARQGVYYPYLLKEYRNRWFLIARQKNGQQLLTLALDRIEEFMEMSPKDFVPYVGVSFERYFEDTIGVTKNEKDRPKKIILWVERALLPYVITKPIHLSQQLLSEDEAGGIVRLDVVHNYELEREILGFGDSIKVLSPRFLKSRMKKRLQKAVNRYLAEE